MNHQALKGILLAIWALGSTSLHAQFDSSVMPIDTREVKPLDVHPGCWQIRLHTSYDFNLLRATADMYRSIYPNFTEQQLAEVVAQMNAQVEKQQAGLSKGSEQTLVQCPLSSDYVVQNLAADPHCAKTLQSTGRALHQRVVCLKPDRHAESAEKRVDVDLTDPDHLKGSIDTIYHTEPPSRSTVTFVAKRVSDIGPHEPTAVTDLDGVRPKGVQAVTMLDPDRIVARVGGESLTASQASALLDLMGEGARYAYGSKPAPLLEAVHLHKSVADEALARHLDERGPWHHQLEFFGLTTQDMARGPQDHEQMEFHREKILWEAYLAQADTEQGKQALVRELKERYRLKVVDPDFFVEVPKAE